MSAEKAILKLPHVQRFFAERDRMIERETISKLILRALSKRFDQVPEDLAVQLRAIQERQKLEELLVATVVCPDLEAFRAALRQQ
jgi:hypothetical protein